MPDRATRCPNPTSPSGGSPIIGKLTATKFSNCFIRGSTAGHSYQTRNDPCRFSHDGNFNETDLKSAGFRLEGAVIVEPSVPLLLGLFGPISSYDKRVAFPVVIQVVESDSPLLAKCRRVDYLQAETKGGYRGDAVAYDCGRDR